MQIQNAHLLLAIGLALAVVATFGAIPFLTMRTKWVRRTGLVVSLIGLSVGLCFMTIASYRLHHEVPASQTAPSQR